MISNQTSFHQMKENIRHSYVSLKLNKDGFHSERNQTAHSMDVGTYPTEIRDSAIQYHIKYPVQALLTHIKQIFNDKGFKVTEIFPGKLLLVKLGLTDRLKFIFTKKLPKRYLLTLTTYEFRSVRRLTINRLLPDLNPPNENQNYEQIREFLCWIDQAPLNIVYSPQNNNEEENQNNIDFSEYQQDMYSLEATSTYMYHKIFVDHNYSLGKKMNKLVQEGPGTQSSNSIGSGSTKQIHQLPISDSKMVIGALNEITQDMLQNFNCTRKELLEILCHCRKTVQDYYHHKRFIYKTKEEIQSQLSELNEEIDTKIQSIQKVPQTIKQFKKLLGEYNSTAILRGLFICHFVFDFECKISQLSDTHKKKLGEQLGKLFESCIQKKIKILQLWGYSHQCWDEYVSIFIQL